MTARTGTDLDQSSGAEAAAVQGAVDRAPGIRLRLEELLGPVEEWSPHLVAALIGSFHQRAAAYLQTLAEAVEVRDSGAVTRDGHSLKGMAGNLGASDLAVLSEAMETCGRTGELALAPGLLTRLAVELDAVRPALDTVLALAPSSR